MVRLTVKEDHGNDDESRRDESQPIDPSPTDRLRDKTANDGRARRAEHGTQHPNRHGPAALTDGEEVGDDGAADGLGGRPANTAHEAEEDEGVERGRKRTPDEPHTEPGVGAGEDDVSAVDFGQRREEQGPDGIAQEEDAHGHGALGDARLLKVLGDEANGRCQDRRCKGRHEGDCR